MLEDKRVIVFQKLYQCDMSRLNRYNIKAQKVELRPPNLGKEVTDHLPFVKIEPELLDLYSELNPLEELIPTMSDKLALVVRTEIPKWYIRSKLHAYGWGVIKSLLKMNYLQHFQNIFIAKDKEEDLIKLKNEIKEYAMSLGYICGVTRIDRRFIAEARDEKFPYDTALVLGMEMDKTLLEEVPRPGKKLFDFEVYIKSGEKIFMLSKFIRSKGYRCWVRVPFDAWVKYPPHAINAGLGELGAQGVVITKEFGPRQRWGMISIDAAIESDFPVDLNMADYCDACKKCIRVCPGKAISENRVWWRGVLKRKINDTRCWPNFKKYDGCGICLKVCPINRHGYDACMAAFKLDGTILGRKKKNEV
ncbi:MAG: 4Fe-4S double cluster binding domain-containing protein [Pseudomonadota bacterium]